MTRVTYHLRDLDEKLVAAWQKYFANIPEVQPATGDIFAVKVEALISPANGFGYMTGGIDRIYSKRLGPQVQENLQAILQRDHDGELPVGLAVLVETGNADIPYLISAPTMRVPINVSQTLNAYLAFRAALRVIQKKNQESPGAITSVACPGMATATGEMPPDICARQMHAAYLQVVGGQPWRPADLDAALAEHQRLLRPED